MMKRGSAATAPMFRRPDGLITMSCLLSSSRRRLLFGLWLLEILRSGSSRLAHRLSPRFVERRDLDPVLDVALEEVGELVDLHVGHLLLLLQVEPGDLVGDALVDRDVALVVQRPRTRSCPARRRAATVRRRRRGAGAMTIPITTLRPTRDRGACVAAPVVGTEASEAGCGALGAGSRVRRVSSRSGVASPRPRASFAPPPFTSMTMTVMLSSPPASFAASTNASAAACGSPCSRRIAAISRRPASTTGRPSR